MHHIGYVASEQQGNSLLEIYTGWVQINEDSYNSDRQFYGNYTTFVPFEANKVRPVLWREANALKARAVIATPTAFAGNEAETVVAVDGADVGLERQPWLDDIYDADVACLVLHVYNNVRNSIFYNYAYQVTVLWAYKDSLTPVDIPGNKGPAFSDPIHP
ncbi:hypothetical protein ACFYR1_53375 [Streptomyces canus]|uniref:hypothetical protein n=1 Tax=Streptomyces canus TaxID=58343 RepID=UPI0036B49618